MRVRFNSVLGPLAGPLSRGLITHYLALEAHGLKARTERRFSRKTFSKVKNQVKTLTPVSSGPGQRTINQAARGGGVAGRSAGIKTEISEGMSVHPERGQWR